MQYSLLVITHYRFVSMTVLTVKMSVSLNSCWNSTPKGLILVQVHFCSNFVTLSNVPNVNQTLLKQFRVAQVKNNKVHEGHVIILYTHAYYQLKHPNTER